MHRTIIISEMEQAITWLLLVIEVELVASQLRFPFPVVTTHLCSDVGSSTIVDKHEAVGGKPPISYTFSCNSTLFGIDEDTGIITVDNPLMNANDTDLVLYKHVTDERGTQAKMVIHVTIVRPVMYAKACPKIQELRVREIAPVGEEVGLVECISNIPDTDISGIETPLSVSIRGVSSESVPFNITTQGVVVASRPLVYRNNIQDINIFNVTMVYLKGGGDPTTNCSRSETKITVKVIVEKSDCNSNWTYETKRNVYLAVEPILTMPQSVPEECSSVCTNNETLVCHGFNYNVVKKECLFLNETEYTQANMTKRRLGMLLYRKYCKTEIFPMAVLRNVMTEIENATVFNTSTSAGILGKLLPVMEDATNISIQDAVLASIIFLHVVNKSDFANASSHQLEIFLQIGGQVFDEMLLKSKYIEPDKKIKMYRILTVFDTLMETLGHTVRDDLAAVDIRSRMTTFNIQRVTLSPGQNHVSTVDSYSGRSGLRLTLSSRNASDTLNKTILVTGTIDGLEEIVSPSLSHRKQDTLSLTVKGHVVSVVLEPVPSNPFEIQLDIPTSGGTKGGSSRMCAFLQRHTYRHSIWDTDGCVLVNYNNSHTRCACSHLTNFAVLMQVTRFQLEEIHVTSLEILTVIGCCISIAALSTTVAVLLWFRLRSERYILLLHLSVAVVLAQVVFLGGIDAVHVKTACRLVAILLHYLYLSVFTLMLAEGIHLFHKLHRAFDADDNLNMLLVLGWGSPFVIVSLSLLSDGDGYSSRQNCWLSADGAIWAFVGPALTVIAINMAILIMIIRTFLGVTIVAKKTDVQKFKASLKATVVLLPLLGITWMFGVVAVNKKTVVFQYIFAILNSLQGLFIFLFHVVFNEDVKKACSLYKRNQVTCVDSLPQTSSAKRFHKKANLYSMSTSL